MSEIDALSFEDAMKQLEEVVRKLEQGDVPLEESIKLYERGAKLKAHCERKLKEAEEKVARITLGPDGKPAGIEPVEGL
ncbi:exodeoxyribonuclease VII small subunit [Albidovulum inexpectatum]|uniref:Exodeoxyribonuclease 7 small subunit n=1 Tax=Albidovulum inexpectatum TaxID=196587 RepID=A0A2S5JLW9_9RHOB|nr:exodeoxyribonuclease VII small subunit [Albidovulum inexpectatum]PPB82484.1 exodeoxyribonuclease VII small subunit [Albidovulum inexpectatum]